MKTLANILYLIKVGIAWGINWFIAGVGIHYFCSLIKAPYTWREVTALWVLLACFRYIRKTFNILWEEARWVS